MTKIEYANELIKSEGLDFAINIFKERESLKSKLKHKSFEAMCDWSGDSIALDYLLKLNKKENV